MLPPETFAEITTAVAALQLEPNIAAQDLCRIQCNRRKSSSTPRWNDVPRGTMDEVSSYVRLNLPSH